MKISDIVIPKYLQIFNNKKIKHIILTSGRAGTKSSYAAIRTDYQIISEPHGSAVVLRKHHNKLRKTVYKEMLRGINRLGISKKKFTITKSPMEITYKKYGTTIYFSGSDGIDDTKGIIDEDKPIKLVVLDELTEFFDDGEGEDELSNIEATFVRGNSSGFQMIYLYNPPKNPNAPINQWCKKMEKRDDCIHIHTDYRDVPVKWLGQDLIASAEAMKQADENGHNDVWCYIEAPKGLALDETIYPMIQLASSTDESYEPYTGGKPSPSPDYPQEIKRVVNPTMKVCGKNLWDNFKTLSLGNVEQKNGTYIATADNMQVDITMKSVGARPLLLKANNAYTFSLKTTVSISSPKFVCLRYTNGESNNIIFTNKNFVNFVPKRDVEKVGFILYESVAGDKVYDVQLEMGSEATYYEPYTEQSVQLPYTLNAIPVASGGNVTIDGQQYIADRVVEKDGVFGIERNTATDVPVLTKELRETPDMKGRFIQDGALKKIFTPFYEPLVNIGYGRKWGVAGSVIDKWIFGVNKVNLYISPPKDLNYTSEDIFNAIKDLNIKVYGALLVPFFEPLPVDIQAKLRTFVTNYPVTNISVTSDQLDGYTVFNYPISMANGWNYVKQQLNDNRDYIYDMDLQSAEAYVNSEYAVALTELEV